MKKIILFIVITLTLMLIPKAYAASTVEEISNINIPPLLSEKKYVYINNMDNYTIKINDNANFEVLDKGNSYIVTQNIPTSNKIYNNPFEVSWDKIGYYVDDNGKPVYLDAKVKVNKIILKWTDDISDSNYRYYSVGQVGSFGLELLGRGYDNDFKNYNANIGIHDYFTITLYNDDGSELNSDLANSLYLQWSISDLDMGDRTVTKNRRIYENDGVPTEFSESIKFDSGFDNKFYVINDSVLKITENNTKYIATESTSNDSDVEKSIDFSTVVAYQTGASAEAEWWGCECGTTIVAVSNQYISQDAVTGYRDANNRFPGQNWVYVLLNSAATLDEFTQWIAEHNIFYYYKLATPQTIELGTIDLPELTNPCELAIYASLDPEWAITYEQDPNIVVTAIQSSIAPVEGATASANYSVGAYLMHGNQLYRVTSAIATGEAITPGSNCIACTVMGEVIRLTA